MICTPWGYRVARVKKFKIHVTSHLKIIIFIIKDIQISKCDIIFENGRFWAFKGGGVPILSHPSRGILSHFADNVTGGMGAILGTVNNCCFHILNYLFGAKIT